VKLPESVTNLNEKQVFEFGDFRVDDGSRTLSCKGEPVALTAKVYETLLYLVSNHGRVVDKDELMREIWSDTIVEENNLNKNISKLRQVLGEKPGEHKFIATVPGKGYKFVAPVRNVEPGESGANTSLAPGPGSGGDSDEALPIPLPGAAAKKVRRPGLLFLFAAAAVVFAVGTGIYFLSARNSSNTDGRLTKLAILPFKPLVPESRDEALEMGIAETLIARLGDSGEVVVRPLGSARRFGAVDQDAQAAGLELGVDAVLDGSIQRSGSDVRVTVRLLNVATGAATWSGTYDEQFTNIFAVQDKIAGRVADSLKIRLRSSPAANRNNHQTLNPEAYKLYLQGRYLSQKITPAEVRRGIEYYQQAIDADPAYALAYAGMADAYRSLPINGDVPATDVMPKAMAAASKALEIDPQLADAHNVLGYVDFWFDHDWAGAEKEFKTALQLSPNNADAHRGYSILLTCLGRHTEAIDRMSQARDLDPLSIITGALQGQTYLFARRYDEAAASLNKTFELDPNFWVAHIQMARLLIQQNNLDGAVAEAEKARQYSGGNSEAVSLMGYAAARSGQDRQLSESLQTLAEMGRNGLVTHYNTALVYNGAGRTGDAIAELQRAVDARDVRLILLKVDPKWDNLRSDPTFAAIIKQMNF
jgi:serine/threonine-protein kinase